MSTPDMTETDVDVGAMYKWAVHTLKSNVTKLSLRQLKTHYLDYIAPWKNFDSFVKSTSILEYAILDSCAKAWSLPHPEPTIGYHKYSYVSSPPSPRIHHRSLNPGIFSTCLWSNKKKNMLKSTTLITDESHSFCSQEHRKQELMIDWPSAHSTVRAHLSFTSG